MNLNPKTTAAAVAGAVTVLIVFLAAQFGLEIPGDVAAAITTVIAVVAAYLKGANDWSPR